MAVCCRGKGKFRDAVILAAAGDMEIAVRGPSIGSYRRFRRLDLLRRTKPARGCNAKKSRTVLYTDFNLNLDPAMGQERTRREGPRRVKDFSRGFSDFVKKLLGCGRSKARGSCGIGPARSLYSGSGGLSDGVLREAVSCLPQAGREGTGSDFPKGLHCFLLMGGGS